MRIKEPVANLLITVELDGRAASPSVGPADLDAARGRLLGALQRNGLSATWAMADPALSASTRALVNSTPRQEVALLSDPRTELNDGQLSERMKRCREQGIDVAGLVLRDGAPIPSLPLLTKLAINAVRVLSVHDPLEALFSGDRVLSQGLYAAPIAWQVGAVSGWLQQWQLLSQAVRQMSAGGLHLVLSTGQMAVASRRTWTFVERLLDVAGQRQRRGRLRTLMLGQLAEQQLRRHAVQPLRSILRAA